MTVVMLPIEQLIVRRLELTRGRSPALRESATILAALLLGTTACVMVAVGALGTGGWYVLVAALLVGSYTVFALARGYLAGRHRYRDYGIATAAEAMGRLLLAGAVLLVTRNPVVLAVVLVLAPLGVLLVRPFTPPTADPMPVGRASDEGPVSDGERGADALVGRAGRFLGPLVVANGAAQTVLGAGPIVVGAIGAGPSTVSSVFVVFTLFRGPLWLVPSVLARVLRPFTALVRQGERATLQRWSLWLAACGAALAAVGGAKAWWLGPHLVALLFGDEFTPTATLTALEASGTALAAMTALSSQTLIALGSTGDVALAWGAALAVAALVLLAAGAPEVRVGRAFLTGEATALALVTVLTVARGGPVERARGADASRGEARP